MTYYTKLQKNSAFHNISNRILGSTIYYLCHAYYFISTTFILLSTMIIIVLLWMMILFLLFVGPSCIQFYDDPHTHIHVLTHSYSFLLTHSFTRTAKFPSEHRHWSEIARAARGDVVVRINTYLDPGLWYLGWRPLTRQWIYDLSNCRRVI